MSTEKILTREIAEQFLADDESVKLSEFTEMADSAAEVLVTYEGKLDLEGIRKISLDAIVVLGKSFAVNSRSFKLTELSEEVADALSEVLYNRSAVAQIKIFSAREIAENWELPRELAIRVVEELNEFAQSPWWEGNLQMNVLSQKVDAILEELQ